MRHIIINPHEIKPRHYAAHMTEINKYFAIFQGMKKVEKLEIFH